MIPKNRTRLGVPTRKAEDWEEAALDVIAAGGVGAVSIPELAKTLAVTKGSFYWHFTGLEDLVERAIKRWDALDKATLDEIRAIVDPALRLRTLFAEAMAARRAQAVYIALALAPSRKTAASLRKVSSRRLDLLAASYRELGLGDTAAQHQALLAYSAYLGGIQLRGNDAPWLRADADVHAYTEHAAAVLIPRPKARKAR